MMSLKSCDMKKSFYRPTLKLYFKYLPSKTHCIFKIQQQSAIKNSLYLQNTIVVCHQKLIVSSKYNSSLPSKTHCIFKIQQQSAIKNSLYLQNTIVVCHQKLIVSSKYNSSLPSKTHCIFKIQQQSASKNFYFSSCLLLSLKSFVLFCLCKFILWPMDLQFIEDCNNFNVFGKYFLA